MTSPPCVQCPDAIAMYPWLSPEMFPQRVKGSCLPTVLKRYKKIPGGRQALYQLPSLF